MDDVLIKHILMEMGFLEKDKWSHCLRADGITWTNVDLLSNGFCSIHLRVIAQKTFMMFLW